MAKRLFRYFAVLIGNCVEIRRGFEPPKRITSKLQLPKKGGKHPETGELLSTLFVQTCYRGGKVIAICDYTKFARILGTVPKGCKEIKRSEKDLLAPVWINLL